MTGAAPVVLTASVPGRAHRRLGRGGQDVTAMVDDGACVAVCVADGCSAGARSEVGAGVGARFVAADAARRVREGATLAALPALVMGALVHELRRLTRALAVDEGDVAAVVEEHLLFTVVAAVATGDSAVVFGAGDGLVSVDGRVIVLDEGPAPDYPAYALFDGRLRAHVHHVGSFSSSLAVCSDGAGELIAARDAVLADGTALGGLAEFERGARYLHNKSLAQKRMNAWCACGGPVDDCSVAVIRRGPPCP